MTVRSFSAACDLCGHLYSVTRLTRARYEPDYDGGYVMDQGVLCLHCWRDLPMAVLADGHVWSLIGRAY